MDILAPSAASAPNSLKRATVVRFDHADHLFWRGLSTGIRATTANFTNRAFGGGKGVQPTAMDTDFVDVAHVQSIKVEKDKMI